MTDPVSSAAAQSDATPHALRLTPHGSSVFSRIWAICAKDIHQELRGRLAITSVFFFAVTALTLVSFAVGPFGIATESRDGLFAALVWIVLFFCAATGLPRAFVREEESGTALALRRVASGPLTLAGKTLFNFLLFLAVAFVTVPAFALLLEWNIGSLPALSAVLVSGGLGLSIVATFLSAIVARASQKNVLFVVISFPLLIPLLLSAISATAEASRANWAWIPIRVLLAYDGAAACAAYLLAGAAWED